MKFQTPQNKTPLKSILFFFAFVFVFVRLAPAQNVKVYVKADTTSGLIGDQIPIELKVESDRPTQIVWPFVPDTLGKLEVVSRSEIDSISKGEGFVKKQKLVVTCFDSGSYEFPALVFSYKRRGFDQLYPISANPILLYFDYPVLDSSDIKDIKPPLAEPFTLSDYLIYIIAALAIIGVLALVYFLWVKKKPKDIFDLDYDPNIPAHILALESLQSLKEEKLWQKGKVKLYYSKLTDIFRLYIARRFGIDAREMTSSEILRELEKLVPADLLEKTRTVFYNADLAKFAKYEPLAEDNEKSLEYCVEFVNETIPAEKPEATDEEEKADNNIEGTEK